MVSGPPASPPFDIWVAPAANVVGGGSDVLGGQHEFFVLGFPGGWSGAQGVPLPADGTVVQIDHALAAKPVPCLGAATAEVMAEVPRLVAHGARFPRSAWMGGLSRGHPEESADSGQGSAGFEASMTWARVSQCATWCNVCLRSGFPVVPGWRVNL